MKAGNKMKKAHLILIITYFIFIIYFAVFNWEMFIITLNVNFGFTVINLPMVIAIFLFGLLFIMIEWGLNNILKLRLEKTVLEKENEIALLKSAKYDEQLSAVQKNQNSIESLHNKINKLMEKMEINSDEQSTQITASKIAERQEEEKPVNEEKDQNKNLEL